ncbi:MAG: hypothetical protein JW864_12555 [Spirochaetes bacterium]|nr:hypothetical protein [Spirochaetota bacterium]
MKISEYKNLTEFLNIVFDFIRKDHDKPSHETIRSYDDMLNLILDSEYVGFTCRRDIDEYSVDFRLNQTMGKPKVFIFIIGGTGGFSENSLEIDLQDTGNSYFIFKWNAQKVPPFLMDFADNEDRLQITHSDGSTENKFIEIGKYMAFDKFRLYLNQ